MKTPRIVRIIAIVGLVAAAMPSAFAEKWKMDGKEIEGRLSAVYGPLAHIVGKKTMALVTFDSLDDASLDRVARFLATPAGNPKWSESTSVVAKSVKRDLLVLKNGKLVAFDPGTRTEPQLYVIYFSAHWCGPCRRFTPNLVKIYNDLKAIPQVADKFEILFNSWDNYLSEQLNYVTEVGMPWVIVKFQADIDIIEKWKGNGIPCIAVINRNGDILFHSYKDDEYQGADTPMANLVALLQNTDTTTPQYFKTVHRLAIRQQLLAGAMQTLPAKIHYIDVDSNRYHGLEVTAFRVHCTVNEKGRVTNFTTEPALPAVYEAQLRTDVDQWLFIPAVENGKARSQTLTVPVRIGQ